jgi:hypothetical protein
MTGRWQRAGVHAGTPADPVIKHRDGIPWYAAPLPWALHRSCRPQTIELWWKRLPDDWPSGPLAGGRLFCACGGVVDSDANDDQSWVGRNSRRAVGTMSEQLPNVEPVVPHQRIESPGVLSVQSGVRVTVSR